MRVIQGLRLVLRATLGCWKGENGSLECTAVSFGADAGRSAGNKKAMHPLCVEACGPARWCL